MTDHPDPTALRLEGLRLVEAIDAATTMIEEGVRGMAKSDCDGGGFLERNDAREIAREVIEAVCPTLLTTLAALTEERDALIRDKEEAQSLLEWPFASVRELANETGRLRMNEHALTEERDEAVKRAAAMEAALEEISGHAPVKTPPDYATSSDTGEAFDDGYSRGVWEMGQIADAALAPQAEAGEG